MGGHTVLIITQPFDFTADYVIPKLNDRGIDFVRFDTGWFPREASLVARFGENDSGMSASITPDTGKRVDLSQVASIWYRRPRDFSFSADLDPDALKFARNEALYGLGGVLRSSSCLWVNHPEKEVSASYKPFQLTVAAKVGLSIPHTIITNDPKAAKEFIRTNTGRTIYKTLSFPEATSDTYQYSAVFTSLVTPEDLDAIQTIHYTPCLLQEFVRKAFEVRVTIIDRKLFAVALHAPDPNVTDWRPVTDDLRYAVHQLPSAVEERCMCLVRKLGLVFAAIDLVVTPENDYVFLEVNPSGQWAWLEDETGLPMADELVNCLAPFSKSMGR